MKKFISGLLAGLLISMLTITYAVGQLNVRIVDFPILIDGKVWTTDKLIVTINDSTYLPLRAMCEVLGIGIEWNGELKQVEISTKVREKATVTKVTDGDTFEIEGGQKVRLIGVDTPESVHPDASRNTEFGKAASAYTQSKLEGKTVYLERDVSETDRYGRLLRYVYLEDGTFYNELLVKEGYANPATYPPDVKYADVFLAAERYARENNKGLWGIQGSTVVTPTPAPVTQEYQFVGSKESNKYHKPDCRWAKEISAENLITFSSKTDAESKGYEPCGVCRP